MPSGILLIAVVWAGLSLPAAATTRVWTGASALTSNWSDPANWGGIAPVDNDDLLFPPGAGRLLNSNDLPANIPLGGITFTGGGYTLSGNAVLVSYLLQNLATPETNVVALPVTGTINFGITMSGTVSSYLEISGVISGFPTSLSIIGSGTFVNFLKLSGANTYGAGTSLTSIYVVVANDSAFGTGTITSTDSFPSTIELNGQTVANAGVFSGLGIVGGGVVTGNGTWSGPILFIGPSGLTSYNYLFLPPPPSLLIFTGDFTGNTTLTAQVKGANGFLSFENNSTLMQTISAGAGVLYIRGASADISIMPGAQVYSDASVRNISFSGTSGVLGPGIGGPGDILHTHDVSLTPGNKFRFELGGPGSRNSQLQAVGTVALHGALDLYLGHLPLPGTTFTLIQSSGGVTGEFDGLPEGTIFTANTRPIKISYAANGGRNVTLTDATPYVTSIRSRKVHGAAGTFDIMLGAVPSSSNPTEPRSGPAQTLVFVFDKPVTAGFAYVNAGTATVGTPVFNGNEMTVPLTGVADAQFVDVVVGGVQGADGSFGGASEVNLGYLLGDVNANRVVTLSDVGLVNGQLSQPVAANNFLKDVNANGTITLADKAIVNVNLTHSLP